MFNCVSLVNFLGYTQILLDVEVQDTTTALVTWNMGSSSSSQLHEGYEGMELIFSPRKTHLGYKWHMTLFCYLLLLINNNYFFDEPAR